MEIRFLSKRNVREVWGKEDAHFTPWLAAPEPLTYLFDECGMGLGEIDSSVMIETEVPIPGVGRRLDVLVTLPDGSKVAIENQFSVSDHDHLTRALSYAVGLEVGIVIIVAEAHRPEFCAVVEYLNSAATVYEHGIKIFLVQVDVSSTPGSNSVYPSFKLVEGPDEWKGVVELSRQGNANSEAATLVYDFHDRALPYLRESTGIFQNVKPSKNLWKGSGVGISGLQIQVACSALYTTVQIWFHSSRGEVNQAGYEALLKHQQDVEASLAPYSVEWRTPEKTRIIEVKFDGIGYKNMEQNEQFMELAKIAGLMTDVAKKYLGEIKKATAGL